MTSGSTSMYVQAILAACIGLALLVVATPRLIAQVSLTRAPASPEVIIEPADLDSAISATITTLEWQSGDREAYRRLAALWFRAYDMQMAAQLVDDANQSRDRIQEILEAGVEVAPGAPDMWLSLARLEAARGDFTAKAGSFLRNSYLTGPREQWVGTQRVGFSLAHWADLDPTTRMMVEHELRYQPPRSLARLTFGAPAEVVSVIEAEIATREENHQKTFESERRRLNRQVSSSAF